MSTSRTQVIVVGTGIVGLMSAFYLHEAGFKVTCVDAGPDPTNLHYDKRMAGTTFRSGNARHVTATETDPHATSSRAGLIYKPSGEGGWLAKDPTLLTDEEKKWMDDFESFTKQGSRIDQYTDDVCYVNNLGKKLWRKIIRDHGNLFTGTGLQYGVSIFFLDKERAKSEAEFEDKYNRKVERLTIEEIESSYPSLAYACEKGFITGGIKEDCITVNSIDLCVNIINYLKTKKVEFNWREYVVEMKRTKQGDIAGLVTAKRKILRANHYVLSPGWLSQSCLKETKTAGKIMGVCGCWIHIPNPGLEMETLVAHAFDQNFVPGGFKGPFKIDAPEPTGYINATLEGSKLVVSGGYGFVGNDLKATPSFDWPGIQALFDHFEGVIKKIFPQSYKEAYQAGSLDRRICVRPMTASGLGLFEILETAKGGKALVVGANSAGGFTQAPAIADAAVDAIMGKRNRIHHFFDPIRSKVSA